jgi:hypothetical protein
VANGIRASLHPGGFAQRHRFLEHLVGVDRAGLVKIAERFAAPAPAGSAANGGIDLDLFAARPLRQA